MKIYLLGLAILLAIISVGSADTATVTATMPATLSFSVPSTATFGEVIPHDSISKTTPSANILFSHNRPQSLTYKITASTSTATMTVPSTSPLKALAAALHVTCDSSGDKTLGTSAVDILTGITRGTYSYATVYSQLFAWADPATEGTEAYTVTVTWTATAA
jgi:hypothetical protein